MTDLIPYLNFDGNCAEAMRFYERALDGKLEMMMSGADMPGNSQMPKEAAHRIVHARLALPGGTRLYAGDCIGQAYQGIHGVSLALNYDSASEAKKIFERLGDGGKVTMPLTPTFWAKIFGMVTDKFGVHWMVNGEQQAV